MQVCFAICYGPTQTRISRDGQRMIEESRLRSVQTSSRDSCRNMIWISYVELIRYVAPCLMIHSTYNCGCYSGLISPIVTTLPLSLAWRLGCALTVFQHPHQVVEDGYEFFAKRQLVTLFSAPNYCGEFDNAGAMMSVDETLLCSFQVRQPSVASFFCAH